MAKFKVEVGGFVSTYRQRTFTINAVSAEEACEKAEEKFIELQQQRPGNMCNEGIINSIKEVE